MICYNYLCESFISLPVCECFEDRNHVLLPYNLGIWYEIVNKQKFQWSWESLSALFFQFWPKRLTNYQRFTLPIHSVELLLGSGYSARDDNFPPLSIRVGTYNQFFPWSMCHFWVKGIKYSVYSTSLFWNYVGGTCWTWRNLDLWVLLGRDPRRRALQSWASLLAFMYRGINFPCNKGPNMHPKEISAPIWMIYYTWGVRS